MSISGHYMKPLQIHFFIYSLKGSILRQVNLPGLVHTSKRPGYMWAN